MGFVFGILGYFFKKFEFPVAPLVLSLVLGDMLERSLRQSLAMSHNDPSIFFNRPISAVLLTVAVVSLAWPVANGLRNRRKTGAQVGFER